MKLLRYTLACLALSSSLVIAGCGGDDKTPAPAADPITQDDVVDLGDLITQDPDLAAAAEMIGDPATLLAEGRKQGEKARADVAAVMSFIKQVAVGEPTKTGETPRGNAGAVWVKTVNGVELTLGVERTAPNRLRYLMAGKAADGTMKGLLTGVFIKKAPKTGGGRLHVNLTNLSDLFNAPGADGSIHFWFANHKADLRGRRIAYVNVSRRDDPNMQKVNYGADLVRLVGVGGRFRSVAISDFSPASPGNEAVGLRVLWKAGQGGRASGAIATLGAMPQVQATMHECWDKDGKRTAYMDDIAGNDMNNPNEGDVTMCAGFAKEPPPDPMDVSVDGADVDPELDTLLDDAGASTIIVADADDATDIGI